MVREKPSMFFRTVVLIQFPHTKEHYDTRPSLKMDLGGSDFGQRQGKHSPSGKWIRVGGRRR